MVGLVVNLLENQLSMVTDVRNVGVTLVLTLDPDY